MSKQDLTRFVVDVNNNQALQSDLINKVTVSSIVEVGKHHGYQFTEEDVLAYSKEKSQLSETELQQVQGGRLPVITSIVIVPVVISLILSR